MGFLRGPRRAFTPPRSRPAVLAVGGHVFVACSGDRTTHATLTDDAGHTALASLDDGTEVVVVAWRPGWAGSARYCVQATDSGLQGWLPVDNLRKTPTAVPAPAVHAVPAGGQDPGRRFGQRPH